MLDDIDNIEDAIAKFEHINVPNVKRGMFVSGWEDPDDSVEEDENPEGKAANTKQGIYCHYLTSLPFSLFRSINPLRGGEWRPGGGATNPRDEP